ncbi:hypothetical protein Dimus_036361 [Dionaea muscipula]
MGKTPAAYDFEYAAHGGAYYAVRAPPPVYYPPPRKPWVTWLVPLIFAVDVALFVYTMYENDCPETFEEPDQCLFREKLGRFSSSLFTRTPSLALPPSRCKDWEVFS